MGAGASVPESEEEALAQGFTQEQIDEYKSSDGNGGGGEKPKEADTPGTTAAAVVEAAGEDTGEKPKALHRHNTQTADTPGTTAAAIVEATEGGEAAGEAAGEDAGEKPKALHRQGAESGWEKRGTTGRRLEPPLPPWQRHKLFPKCRILPM